MVRHPRLRIINSEIPKLRARIVEALRGYELLFALIDKDLRLRYHSTLLGIGWSAAQPLFTSLLSVLVFRREVKHIPQQQVFVFFYVGMIIWLFFSRVMQSITISLSDNAGLIRRFPFPRIHLPLATIGASFVDLSVQSLVLVIALFVCRVPLNLVALFSLIPLLLLLLALSVGFGLLLCSLDFRFRDTRYLLPFINQIGFLATPLVYPMEAIPRNLRFILAINPLAVVVEGVRYAVLGTPAPTLPQITGAVVASSVLLVGGLALFSKVELGMGERA